MLRWLRRPWGIVTVADIDRAFRGLAPDDKQDEVPRAFSVLTPMLQTEVEDHLASKFGVSTPQRARGLVSRLISCRHSLYLLRRLTRRIHHKRAEQSGRWFRAHSPRSSVSWDLHYREFTECDWPFHTQFQRRMQ